MDIILPVAGFGTRLRPQTWTKPKPLVSVAGKPTLEQLQAKALPIVSTYIILLTVDSGQPDR